MQLSGIIKGSMAVFIGFLLLLACSKPGELDYDSPATITDLTIVDVTQYSVILSWTVPGDDSISGTPAKFAVRYSTAVLTAANWDDAVKVPDTPAPQSVGTTQTFEVAGLSPDTMYYFGVKTRDEAHNWSGLSNIVTSDKDQRDKMPPAAITDLEVVDFTSESVILSWTAPGDDSLTGTVDSYDIRFSTSQITESNWESATAAVFSFVPKSAGETESIEAAGVYGDSTYYFGIKAIDNSSNSSSLSNVVSEDFIVTFPDPALENAIRRTFDYYSGDLTAVKLMELDTLHADRSEITDITGIGYCDNVIVLGLYENNISSLEPISKMSNLKILSIYSNNISDVSPLASNLNLETIILSNNNITDFSALSSLPKLRSLNLNSNPIQNFSGMLQMPYLKNIYLSNLETCDLSYVYGLENLWFFDAINSNLSDISELHTLINLYGLHVDNNQIDDLSPISGMYRLLTLFAPNNEISDISVLTNLRIIHNLDLRSNLISDISVLAELEELDDVKLSDNSITDISPLVNNPGLIEGDEIYLENNPLSEQSVNEYIPALEARGVVVHY